MALFKLLWLRRFIRKNTKPIAVHTATDWQKRLSFAYMIFGWNAFGLVIYMVFSGKADWAKYYGFKSDEEANMPPGKYNNSCYQRCLLLLRILICYEGTRSF